MPFENYISEYGYWAVLFFACIEGEAAMLTAGVLAAHGLLSIKIICLVAFLGTWLWEQAAFFIGRIFKIRVENFINKRVKLQKISNTVLEFVRKYDSVYIFSFRFIYGIRNISPIVIGVAGVSPKKYCLINCLAAMVWATVVPTVGYWFANSLKNYIDNVYVYVVLVMAFVALLSMVPYVIYKLKSVGKNEKF